ncbi:MAG: peptidylprolyl isomerase [Myxococcota bacterium]|nr:peptidylprolyl isomerase [Myxococcota bacterium]
MSEAEIERALPTPTKSAPPHAKAKKRPDDKGAKHGLPPAGSVELRTYSDKELADIFGAVPLGEGVSPEATDLTYEVALETAKGEIKCRLDHTEAPQTAANFIALTKGLRAWRDPDTKEVVERRFYDGLTFHRAIKDFIIQTGNPGTGGSAGPGWTLPREQGLEARYDAPGAMGMVDAGEDSHGSQFFITLRAQKSLKGNKPRQL